MWKLRPLTPLWAFTACYRDSFTFRGGGAFIWLFYTEEFTLGHVFVLDGYEIAYFVQPMYDIPRILPIYPDLVTPIW
jgi:hypothetical protein